MMTNFLSQKINLTLVSIILWCIIIYTLNQAYDVWNTLIVILLIAILNLFSFIVGIGKGMYREATNRIIFEEWKQENGLKKKKKK